MTSVISHVINANRGRYTDALTSYTPYTGSATAGGYFIHVNRREIVAVTSKIRHKATTI